MKPIVIVAWEVGLDVSLALYRALFARFAQAQRCALREDSTEGTIVAEMRGNVERRAVALAYARNGTLTSMLSAPNVSADAYVVYGRIAHTEGGSIANLSVRIADGQDRELGTGDTDALGRFTIRIAADAPHAEEKESKKGSKSPAHAAKPVFVSIYDKQGNLLFKDQQSLATATAGESTLREITVA